VIQPALDAIWFIPDSTDVLNAAEEASLQAITFEVFPNPASDYIQIKTNTEWQQFQLFDLNGRLLQRFYPHTHTPRLQLNDLSNGLYLLQGITKNQAVLSRKIIIQH
jgi:hypothetical protein